MRVRGLMWSDISEPWQSCLKLAWEAYCDECIPIGAVVTGADGIILTKGRNRIFEKVKPGGVNGAALAHAELEALQSLDFDAVDPHECFLYTTTEPCPMCMGAIYMSGLRTLHFAARDPYAGSTNMLGKTWYLKRKTITVNGPLEELEWFVTTLFAEQEIRFRKGNLPENLFWDMYADAIPGVLEFARHVASAGLLQDLKINHATAQKVFDTLISQVKSTGRFISPAGMEGHV